LPSANVWDWISQKQYQSWGKKLVKIQFKYNKMHILASETINAPFY
jgi:hypothetical protein